MEPAQVTTVSRFRRWRPWVNSTLCLVVLGFVGRRAYQLWMQQGESLADLSLSWSWLVASAVVYLVAWLPSIWFWHVLMVRLGARLRLRDTARAYYVGHLGKYAPGKGLAVVLRAALVRQPGFRASTAALSVACETMTMMGTGGALALGLLPWLVSDNRQAKLPAALEFILSHAWLPPLIALTLALAALPAVSLVYSKVARRMTPAEVLESSGPATIDAKLLAKGYAVFVAAWLLQAVSLGCALRAVGADWSGPADLRALVATITASNVLGFVAIFAPAGVGVREGALIELLPLRPGVSPAQAVAVAVLYRLVNLAAEAIAAIGLYYIVKPPTPTVGSEPTREAD